ncbi:dihydrolipoyl dehydrogenase [Neorickettsia risticii]|uniref:Dihydrolipoyl dehydrogenase n=1 Tax=Neorickettsia risticii (strain Illinois) TaxID=434131 RepID=C6V4V4_NEORI|nr:dihydrolipoyl dehydrogenase [Neorickettsia risticii]ACT69430.1 dihydrolipoyl dehydrogenase [Neorickettsia risticii str. Illinois]
MYDVIVVGGGPAGYPAAIRASRSGLKVALVEKNKLGGVCLNYGCIPTKALLHVAEKYHFVKTGAAELGINVSGVSLSFGSAIAYAQEKIKKLAAGVSYLMKKNKVEIFYSSGRILPGKKVELGDLGKTISAKNIILATGSTPREIAGLEYDHELIWNYNDAMTASKMPESLLVVGAGAIGVEFACIYNAFGSKVTIIEMQSQVLPAEDTEISNLAEAAFKESGITIQKGTTIQSLKKDKDKVLVALSDGTNLVVERILVAAGVEANSQNLGLEQIPTIRMNKGFVSVDEYCETGESGVYAIGDLRGFPCVAHKAIYDAYVCTAKIAGKEPIPLEMNSIPSCIYSFPSIASIGLTEEAAVRMGHKVKIGRAKAEGNGKSVVLGKDKGLVKTVFDSKTGELLGAHIIGYEATEILNGYIIAKASEATIESLKAVVFPHPTVSEMMYEAVLAADNEEVHS